MACTTLPCWAIFSTRRSRGSTRRCTLSRQPLVVLKCVTARKGGSLPIRRNRMGGSVTSICQLDIDCQRHVLRRNPRPGGFYTAAICLARVRFAAYTAAIPPLPYGIAGPAYTVERPPVVGRCCTEPSPTLERIRVAIARHGYINANARSTALCSSGGRSRR